MEGAYPPYNGISFTRRRVFVLLTASRRAHDEDPTPVDGTEWGSEWILPRCGAPSFELFGADDLTHLWWGMASLPL